tara:strand:- start:7374 stop:8009 length:636 start_codon:yes stop_codon:yes gene_type:complete
MENTLKTGTTTIGIVCKDGIILAADKRATAGYLVVNKKEQKIHEVSNNMALTTAGTVSDIQLMVKLVRAEIKLKSIRVDREPTVKETANLLAGLVYQNIRKFSTIPGISHFLFAGVDKTGFTLYDIFPDGSLSKHDDYTCSGSGSVYAYGVLETLHSKDITIDQGIKLALKAINAAMQRDIASGNGIDILTITSTGVKRVMERELDTRLKE